MNIDYAIIVKSKTRLESLIERFNTKAQAKFYIESLGGDFNDYEVEHEKFYESLIQVQTQLSKVIKNKTIDRLFLPSYIFAKNNLIVILGQDGLVANTAKYSKQCPIIAINPDTQRYDGILLPFNTNDFMLGINNVLSNNYKYKTYKFAEAKLNDGQKLLAFNDIFIGTVSHTSAKYKITFNNVSEYHSSSGLIISTKAGATGWLSSICNMAFNFVNLFDKNVKIKYPNIKDNELFFTVREPFKSFKTQIGLTVGIIKNQTELIIESLMPIGGVIFSDGIETDFLQFNSGSIVKIKISSESVKLVLNQ